MKDFAKLYRTLDESNRTTDKVDAMVAYFRTAPPGDAAWALWFLTGQRFPRALPSTTLRAWVAEESEIPSWLVDECYDTVGDLAETLALLLPPQVNTAQGSTDLLAGSPKSETPSLEDFVHQCVEPLRRVDPPQQRQLLQHTWAWLDIQERLVYHKLILGAFRVGVARTLVARALAEVAGVSREAMAHRLMGGWKPSADDFTVLVAPEDVHASEDPARPYPFCLAYALEGSVEDLGSLEEWQAEWKWDGIRGQVIRRKGQSFVWTRGEELVTDRYPEIADFAQALPNGTVIDGEIMAWKNGEPLPFALLQTRIGRKSVGPKTLRDAPVAFVAYDLLEVHGEDIRAHSMRERRDALERLFAELPPGVPAVISPIVRAGTWSELTDLRATSRERRAEGLMLKRRDSPYGVGRTKGNWWKWKIEPFTMDAVLIYAQPGHGRRATLCTDYTFAVWDGEKLVPVAKAYSGLTDLEINEVDKIIKRTTVERFGPVRSVTPEIVMELAFEGIQESPRHKSGIAVRFPRIARWRKDKTPADADTLDTLKTLAQAQRDTTQTPLQTNDDD